MRYDLRPDANAAERAAVLKALRQLGRPEPAVYASAWRRAALDAEDDDDYAGAPARPRSNPGAARA